MQTQIAAILRMLNVLLAPKPVNCKNIIFQNKSSQSKSESNNFSMNLPRKPCLTPKRGVNLRLLQLNYHQKGITFSKSAITLLSGRRKMTGKE